MTLKVLMGKAKASKMSIIIIAALAGVLCIGISSLSSAKENKLKDEGQTDYSRELENKISSLIEKAAEGVSADVLITFESVISDNTNQGTDFFDASKQVSTTQKETPLPKVKGVMIVCKGLNHQSDFNIIKRAVATALAIDENQIYIIGGVTQQ
ncbi:MAG: hypothetical protein E7600_08275 [Ruminococcaceae bacterium]|nr:hypothetical protein [Oscillospiraceae bacterium]